TRQFLGWLQSWIATEAKNGSEPQAPRTGVSGSHSINLAAVGSTAEAIGIGITRFAFSDEIAAYDALKFTVQKMPAIRAAYPLACPLLHPVDYTRGVALRWNAIRKGRGNLSFASALAKVIPGQVGKDLRSTLKAIRRLGRLNDGFQ